MYCIRIDRNLISLSYLCLLQVVYRLVQTSIEGSKEGGLLVIQSLKCSSPHPDQGSLKLLTKINHVIGWCLDMKNFSSAPQNYWANGSLKV